MKPFKACQQGPVVLRAKGGAQLPQLPRRGNVLALATQNGTTSGTAIHYVQAGETLVDIAHHHGCSVRTIKELNYGPRAILKNDYVEPGRRLILPAGSSHMVSVAAEQTLHNAALQPQVQGALLLAGIGLLGFLSAAFARILNKLSTNQAEDQLVEVYQPESELAAVRTQTAAITTLLEEARREMQEAESHLALVQKVRDAMRERHLNTVASNAVAFTPVSTPVTVTAIPEKVPVAVGATEGGVATLPPSGGEDMTGVVDSLNRVWRKSQGGSGVDPLPPPPTPPHNNNNDTPTPSHTPSQVQDAPHETQPPEDTNPASETTTEAVLVESIETAASQVVTSAPAEDTAAAAVAAASAGVPTETVETVIVADTVADAPVEMVIIAAEPVDAPAPVSVSVSEGQGVVVGAEVVVPAATEQPSAAAVLQHTEAATEVTAAAAAALVSTEPDYGSQSINSYDAAELEQPAEGTAEGTAAAAAVADAPAVPAVAVEPTAAATTQAVLLSAAADEPATPAHISVDAFELPAVTAAAAEPAAEAADAAAAEPAAEPADAAAAGVTALTVTPKGVSVALTPRGPEPPRALTPFSPRSNLAVAAAVAAEQAAAAVAAAVAEQPAAALAAAESAAESMAVAAAPQPSQQPTPTPTAEGSQGPAGPAGSQQQPAKRPAPKHSEALQSIKASLMEGLYSTGRGAHATSEQRAVAEERISALECRNPNNRPTECLPALHGRWKLVYTSSPQTLLLLSALDSLPLVELGDVYQDIDTQTMTARNKIDIKVPVNMTLHADTSMQVKTARALKIQITRVGVDTFIRTPQLLTALEVPDTVDFWGTPLDLSPVRRYVVDPFNAVLETSRSLWNRAVSPDLEVQAMESTTTWMLTTYLDDTLRITRDASGNVFVLLREIGEAASAHESTQQ